MISICVPIYNHNVVPLAQQLATQMERLKGRENCEIVCIDDHSSEPFLSQNSSIGNLANYILLDENIGRARIRNAFLEHAQGEWLLFLDNDSILPDDFLEKYCSCLSGRHDVIVGGRVYDGHSDDRQHHLRYLYGTQVESRLAAERSVQPYRSFMTNNFMVRRAVFEKIKFDIRLDKYGHEDTLFGYRLEETKVPILHIDNPVVNGYVETNVEFLQKTVEGIESLAKIYGFMQNDNGFCQSVRLLRTYEKVKKYRLAQLVYRVFAKRRAAMEHRFVEGDGFTIRQFNFYKLGLFIQKTLIQSDNKTKQ